MSYSIEYNRHVAYIKDKNGEKVYFLFIRYGDNNVFTHDGQRVKDWYLAASGTEKELWKVIAKSAGCVEGGGIQKCKGWMKTEYFTIEEYIKLYRSKIKNAKPLEEFLDKFSISACIILHKEFTDKRDMEVESILRDFIKRYEMNECGAYPYDKTRVVYKHYIQDFESLRDFLLNSPRKGYADYRTNFDIEKRTPVRVGRRRYAW